MKQAEKDEIKELTVKCVHIGDLLDSLSREITENVKPNIEKIRDYNEIQNGHIRGLIKDCSANTMRGKLNTRLVCLAIGIAVGVGVANGIGFIP